MDDKDKEFLTNMSQMKGGEMQITIPQSLMEKFGKDFNDKSEVKLSQLNQTQLRILKENREKLEEMNPEDIAKAQFTAMKNSENYLKSIAAEVVQGGKNKIFGRNEYTGEKEPVERGAATLEIIGQARQAAIDIASKKVLLGVDNVITGLIKNVASGMGTLFKASVERIIGGDNDPETMKKKIEGYYKTLYQLEGGDMKEYEADKKRMEKYYKEGTGKDQRISANIKITQVGLGENFRIDQNGKSFLDVYNV
jgi:hypothetical protein